MTSTTTYQDIEITHLCPPEGSGLMPCCGRTPFEVSEWSRMTLDPELVTCHKDVRPGDTVQGEIMISRS